MIKKVLLILLVVLTLGTFKVSATSFEKYGVVSDIDKSEMCQVMCPGKYCITILYDEATSDYEFIRVSNEIIIKLNDSVIRTKEEFIINNTHYHYHEEQCTPVLDYIKIKAVADYEMVGLNGLDNNVYRIVENDSNSFKFENGQLINKNLVDITKCINCDNYYLLKVVNGEQVKCYRNNNINFNDGNYYLLKNEKSNIYFIVDKEYFVNYYLLDYLSSSFKPKEIKYLIDCDYFFNNENLTEFNNKWLIENEINVNYLAECLNYKSLNRVGEYTLNQEIFDCIYLTGMEFKYTCYCFDIKNGIQVNSNDPGISTNFNSELKNNILLSDDIIKFNYDLKKYLFKENIELKSLKDYKGLNGKCDIKLINNKYYSYKLYDKNSNNYYEIKLNKFIPEYNLDSLEEAYFIFLEENQVNLYIEMIFLNGKHLLYCVNLNKIYYKSILNIKSTDITFNIEDGITNYYLYFNSSIKPDEWLSMTFDVDYKVINTNIFGNKNYSSPLNKVYDVTTNNINLDETSNIDGLRKLIFGSDVGIMNNFTIVNDPFIINGKEYYNRVRLISCCNNSTDVIKAVLFGLFFVKNKTIEIDKVSALKCSYLKNDAIYNSIYIDSEIEAPGEDNPPGEDPYIKKNSPWDLNSFYNEIKRNIKAKTLNENFGTIIENYYGAFIISLLLLFIGFILLIYIFKIIIAIIKLIMYRRF